MNPLKISKSVFRQKPDSFKKYLQEIEGLPALTVGEEMDLAKKIKQGNPDALPKLIYPNIRYAVMLVKRYQNLGERLPQLINDANLGLIHAAKHFDETRGIRFTPYALWWIRQGILQCLAKNHGQTYLPGNHAETLAHPHRTIAQWADEYKREPTDAELEEITHLLKP
jgi:RNA polymerase primary sigma factor